MLFIKYSYSKKWLKEHYNNIHAPVCYNEEEYPHFISAECYRLITNWLITVDISTCYLFSFVKLYEAAILWLSLDKQTQSPDTYSTFNVLISPYIVLQ